MADHVSYLDDTNDIDNDVCALHARIDELTAQVALLTTDNALAGIEHDTAAADTARHINALRRIVWGSNDPYAQDLARNALRP